MKGVIDPDYLKVDHGEGIEKTHTFDYSKNVNDLTLYDVGYIVHLFTDYLFYKVFEWQPEIYDDYNKTNKYLIQKYNIEIPAAIEQDVNYLDGKPKTFNTQQLDCFIDDVATFNISDMYNFLKEENERKNQPSNKIIE